MPWIITNTNLASKNTDPYTLSKQIIYGFVLIIKLVLNCFSIFPKFFYLKKIITACVHFSNFKYIKQHVKIRLYSVLN